MKNFLLICLAIITASALAGGKLHWDERVDAVQAEAVTENEPKQETKQQTNLAGTKTAATSKEEKVGKDEMDDLIQLDKLNFLPPGLQQKFKEKMNKNQPLHLMILGSSSTSEREGAWPQLLEKQLMGVYSEILLKITIKELSNKTSDQVIKENLHKDWAEQKPDILLLEPFLLYDNGEVTMSNRLKNLTVLLEDFKKKNQDLTIMLQPANPIYGAHYYLKEEMDLERYANKHKYTYLNHWDAWPDPNNKEIKEYLTKDNLPNDKGNKVWANFLKEYFVRGVDGE
jgi:lysophospholipase L1-like esterase